MRRKEGENRLPQGGNAVKRKKNLHPALGPRQLHNEVQQNWVAPKILLLLGYPIQGAGIGPSILYTCFLQVLKEEKGMESLGGRPPNLERTPGAGATLTPLSRITPPC